MMSTGAVATFGAGPAATPSFDPVEALLGVARRAVQAAPPIGDPAYLRYCRELAHRVQVGWPLVRDANERDVAEAVRRGMPPTLVRRLRLTADHLDQLLVLTRQVQTQLDAVSRPGEDMNAGDCVLRRIPKPLGVVLMVYEARPTVTLDGALLPVAVGNAVLLRGGKEMAATDEALGRVIHAALESAGLPTGLVTLVNDPDRSRLRAMLKRPDAIDVLVPRGSPSLINYCRTSSIPLIASGGGVNHLYVHTSADPELAATITLDSKLPEPAGCTSVEVILVDRSVAAPYVAALRSQVQTQDRPLTVHLDPAIVVPLDVAPLHHDDVPDPWRTEPLTDLDIGREFLEPVVAVVAVDGLDDAVEHIRRHGSTHTEGVVATDRAVTSEFARRVDAAAVVLNGSLRLHDGPRLGLGPEISIATGRLHVRGPVTLAALVTNSWVVDANGALRG